MTRLLLHGGAVFDARSGTVADADVLLDGDRIVAVGPGLDGDEGVDVSGRTLLPGLFDCHTHVTMSHMNVLQAINEPFSYMFFCAARNLEITLRLGITTIRDAAYADLGVKRAVADGVIRGPRMTITVNMISQTGGHADPYCPCGGTLPLPNTWPGCPDGIVDSPEDVRRTVREVIRAGADVIKVAASGGVVSPVSDLNVAQLSLTELEVMVEEAERAGKYVMAHAHSAAGARNAVLAGVRSIEHGTFLDEDTVALMVERGTWLVPTLLATHGIKHTAQQRDAMPPQIAAKAMAVAEASGDSFRLAVAAGVKVAMGTDCPVSPHGTNLSELALMVEGGLSPAQALQAATIRAAELTRCEDDLGVLESGKRADVVVVKGDPFDFDKLADNVEQVWQNGACVVGEGVLPAH